MSLRLISVDGELMRPNTCFSPVNPGFCYGGVPSSKYIGFYQQRIRPSIGITWIGNVAIVPDGGTTLHTACLSRSLCALESLQIYSATVNGFIGVQLAHCPPYNHRKRNWRTPTPLDSLSFHRDEFSELDESVIVDVLQATLSSVASLRRIGISLVQLHAAHGYFFHQLTSSFLNRRSGAFAWNGPGTIAFLKRFSSGSSIPAARLTQNVSAVGGYHPSFVAQLNLFLNCGFRLIDISHGISWLDKHEIYPRDETNAKLGLSTAMAYRGQAKFIINGRISSSFIEAVNDDDVFFGAGRQIIADPLYFEKISTDSPNQINSCRLSGHCHYFSRSKDGITCPVFDLHHEHTT